MSDSEDHARQPEPTPDIKRPSREEQRMLVQQWAETGRILEEMRDE